MKANSLTWLMLIVLVPSLPVVALEGPKIQVEVRLEEPEWNRRIDDEENRTVGDFQAEAARELVEVFNKHFGFVEFVNEPAPLTLVVAIKRQEVESSSPILAPTIFHLNLVGLPETLGEFSFELPFRSADDYIEPVTYVKFVGETRDNMVAGIASHADQLVTEQLSVVPLAKNKVFIVKDPGGAVGVLPWSCHQIHASPETEITLKTIRPGVGIEQTHLLDVVGPMNDVLRTRVPASFVDGLVAQDHEDTLTSLDLVPVPDPNQPVEVASIHVTFYRSACRPRLNSPSEVVDEQN